MVECSKWPVETDHLDMFYASDACTNTDGAPIKNLQKSLKSFFFLLYIVTLVLAHR